MESVKYGGTRCILLEVSALGARDWLSTSHYRGRLPYPTQSPYGVGVRSVWTRVVGLRPATMYGIKL